MFTRFGTMVNERTRKVIEHGGRIRAVLAQRQFGPLSLGEEVALSCAVADGVLDPVPLELVRVRTQLIHQTSAATRWIADRKTSARLS